MNIRISLAAALATAPLAAQTTSVEVSLKTATPLAVIAQAGTQAAHDAVATNTPIVRGRAARASASTQLKTGEYSSSTTLSQIHLSPAVSIYERHYVRGTTTDGGGTSASPSSTGASKGPHSVLASFKAAPSSQGKLTVTFRANVQYGTNASFNKGAVDIGNDSSAEWSGGGSGSQSDSKEFPISLGASGQVDVLLTTESSTAGTGNSLDFVNCWSELYVTFQSADAGTCTVTPYGQGCGPKLDAAVGKIGNSNVVAWKLTGGHANGAAVIAVGNQKLDLSLGGGCKLLTNAVILTVVPTNASGEWSTTDILWIRNLTTYHQALPLALVGPNLVITASNGQELVCKGF